MLVSNDTHIAFTELEQSVFQIYVYICSGVLVLLMIPVLTLQCWLYVCVVELKPSISN